MTDFVPPVEVCEWDVARWVDAGGYEELLAVRVGPCKTAFDAWRLSRLPGSFGQYEYRPLTRSNEP